MDKNKLDDIEHRIKKLQDTNTLSTKHTATNEGLSIALDLVAGSIVGTIIGVVIDKWLGSKPLFLIICLLIGIAAGFKIIWQKLNSKKNGT